MKEKNLLGVVPHSVLRTGGAKAEGLLRTRAVLCADDKTQILRALKDETPHGLCVMCGDSLSDLGSLLEADVGIVLGNSGTLRSIAAATGVSIRPLTTGRVADAKLPAVAVTYSAPLLCVEEAS